MLKRSKFSRYSFVLVMLGLVLGLAPGTSAQLTTQITAALEAADTALAITLLNKEVRLDKSYYLNYYTIGEIHFARAEYEQALEQFLIAVKKKKKNWNSQYSLGRTHLVLGQLDEAQKVMEYGRKKFRDQKAWFENGFGKVMMARKDYRAADKAFRQALVVEPDNAEYHIDLGDANYYQGIPSLAVSEYKKALAVDTGSLEVHFHWAEACLEMKDYNCAIEQLRTVLQKDSTHATAWMNLGGIYYNAGRSSRTRAERNNRFKETIGSYKRYLDLTGAEPDSSSVRVYFGLAKSYVSLNGYEDAAVYFNDVLSIPYEPKDIYFHYGKCLWGIKDYVKAGEMLLKHFDWVAEQDENYKPTISDREIYQLLGDAFYYRKPNDFVTAIDYYKKALEINPEQKRLVQNVAVGYHSLKSYAQALEYYDKRIELGLDSTGKSIYKNAGFCALNIANAGSGEDEDEDIDEMDEEDGGEEVATGGAGTIDPNINYYELAISYMQKYLEYDPDDLKIVSLVANTSLYQLSDCENGVAAFEKVLALDPDNCEAKKALGFAFFGGDICGKNYSKALTYLRQAYSCISNVSGACGDVDLTLWVAQCFHLRAAAKEAGTGSDDFRQANEWYRKVIKCEPGNTDAIKGRDDTQFEF